jgi:hypothetical protein
MQECLDAMKLALRVLGALNEKRDHDPTDMEQNAHTSGQHWEEAAGESRKLAAPTGTDSVHFPLTPFERSR